MPQGQTNIIKSIWIFNTIIVSLLKMKKFLKFSLIWYSQQFAIPFWIVGHVHLHLTTYQDWVELLCSILLHLSVLAGFLLDWVNYNKNQN